MHYMFTVIQMIKSLCSIEKEEGGDLLAAKDMLQNSALPKMLLQRNTIPQNMHNTNQHDSTVPTKVEWRKRGKVIRGVTPGSLDGRRSESVTLVKLPTPSLQYLPKRRSEDPQQLHA